MRELELELLSTFYTSTSLCARPPDPELFHVHYKSITPMFRLAQSARSSPLLRLRNSRAGSGPAYQPPTGRLFGEPVSPLL